MQNLAVEVYYKYNAMAGVGKKYRTCSNCAVRFFLVTIDWNFQNMDCSDLERLSCEAKVSFPLPEGFFVIFERNLKRLMQDLTSRGDAEWRSRVISREKWWTM